MKISGRCCCGQIKVSFESEPHGSIGAQYG
jgi:hypothetical protein